MLFQRIGEYQNVVQIHNAEAINVASHGFIDVSLKSRRSVSQAERHDKVFIMTVMRTERRLPPVRLFDTYAVVRILEVHAGVVLCSHQPVKDLAYQRQWITILDRYKVEPTVVYTEA